jgi:hypothetical protein
MIRQMGLGQLYVGSRPRPALRVVYEADNDSEQAVYLTFNHEQMLSQVWADLQLDAPSGALP